MAEMMKAVRFHGFGDASVLQYEEAPRPEPKAGEVLVRIIATSVNPLDWKIREGYMQGMMPITLPFIPGGDIAGVVETVGEGVSDFAAGDAVFGRVPPQAGGGYAEYVAAPVALLAKKPEEISFEQAASAPIVSLTAWQSLFRFGGLQPGQSILIHGAAGGLGLFAVQFAKWKGASPIYATASASDKEFVQQLGADTVIDYKNERFEEIVHGVDVVLDTVGGETQERSWGVLKPGGILVATSAPPASEKADAHGVRAVMVQVEPTSELNDIAALLASGTVKTEIGKTLPLSEAGKAQELSQHGHVRGKIVLTVN